jgi:Holliday junction resolvase RusA-like endonuclease
MTQELWVNGPLPGMNEWISAAKRPSWSKTSYTNLKKKWTEDVWKLAKAARLKKVDGPAHISFIWREKNRRRDIDNVSAGAKSVLDGLVKAGVLENDGWEHVFSIEHRFQVDAKNPGVLVHISQACPF